MDFNRILIIVDRERARRGITVEELTKKAHLGRTTYRNWMNGLAKPHLATIEDVLDALDLKLVVRRKKDGTA